MSGITDIEDTVRDFWATRPRRSAADRKVAGVAAAIGRRYAIDPVLVRVAFVVITLFSGVGLLLYLLGWLLLPEEGDSASAAESLLGRGHSSVSPAWTLVLGLAVFTLAAGVVFGGNAFAVIGLAAAGATVFFLHRARAGLGEVPVSGSDPAPGTPAPGTPAPGTPAPGTPAPGIPAHGGAAGAATDPHTQQMTSGVTPERPAPPEWDPLGAAPFAWDLPEPVPVPPPAPPPMRGARSKVTPITLGLALLAGGIASAFWPALSMAHILAIVLAVIGLGMVIGSLVRGGRGLIAIAVPLALLTWVLQAVPVSGFQVGDRQWTPAATAQLAPRYDVTMGSGVLDLSRVLPAEGQTVTTVAVVGMGDLRVLLPPNVDAQVACRASVGDVNCLHRNSSGVPAETTVRDFGSDGPGGGTLVLDARTGMGDVVVERAS